MTDITYMEQNKAKALVGIAGIELNGEFAMCGSAFNMNLNDRGVLHIISS